MEWQEASNEYLDCKVGRRDLNYTREYRYPDSCLVFNQAAQELELCGQEALPATEEAIRERVVPAARLAADHHELLGKFFGLMNLWMAYIAIAGSRQQDRVIQVHALSGRLSSRHGDSFSARELALRRRSTHRHAQSLSRFYAGSSSAQRNQCGSG